MVDRKEVQAGDDALGADEGAGGAQVQQDVIDVSLGGLTAEEQAAFAEMQTNDSARPAEIVQDGDPDDGAAAAARAAEAAAKPPAATEDDDDEGELQEAADAAARDATTTDDDDPTKGGKFPQRVNYRKYKKANDRAEALERELAAEREKSTRIDERIKLLTEAMQAKPPAPQQQEQEDPDDIGEMPDPDKDIFAFAKWQARKNEQLERHLSGVTTSVVGERADKQLEASYMRDIRSFSTTNPDFPEAYKHMMATRLVELALQNYDVDLTEEGAALNREQYDALSKQIVNEEKRLAAYAIQHGKSPAKQLYGMAKARGYQRAAAPAPAPAQNGGNGGARPAPGAAPAAAGGSAVAAAVAAAKRGVETNKSLSEGGGAPEGQLTAEQVLTMRPDDFNRWFNTASPDQIRQVLGQ